MNGITVSQLRRLIPNVKIIDIRDNYQYNLGSIPTAKNVPMNFLLTNTELYLNHYDTYYIYCEYGKTSSSACRKLKAKGYSVIDIIGGYNEYKRL